MADVQAPQQDPPLNGQTQLGGAGVGGGGDPTVTTTEQAAAAAQGEGTTVTINMRELQAMVTAQTDELERRLRKEMEQQRVHEVEEEYVMLNGRVFPRGSDEERALKFPLHYRDHNPVERPKGAEAERGCRVVNSRSTPT